MFSRISQRNPLHPKRTEHFDKGSTLPIILSASARLCDNLRIKISNRELHPSIPPIVRIHLLQPIPATGYNKWSDSNSYGCSIAWLEANVLGVRAESKLSATKASITCDQRFPNEAIPTTKSRSSFVVARDQSASVDQEIGSDWTFKIEEDYEIWCRLLENQFWFQFRSQSVLEWL